MTCQLHCNSKKVKWPHNTHADKYMFVHIRITSWPFMLKCVFKSEYPVIFGHKVGPMPASEPLVIEHVVLGLCTIKEKGHGSKY